MYGTKKAIIVFICSISCIINGHKCFRGTLMKLKLCLLPLICCLLLATQVVAESTVNRTQTNKVLSEHYFSQGREAFNKKDYQNALKLFQESAALNNASADFVLGLLYYAPKPGTSIPQNFDLAIEYMSRSAQLGNIDAKKMLVGFQLKGFGKTTPETIIQLRSKLEADSSSTNRIDNLLDLIDSYLVVRQKELLDINKAKSLIDQLLSLKLNQNQKFILANRCMQISIVYIVGMNGAKKDPQQAFEWMKRAAVLDLKEAYYNLSDMYFYGFGTAVDFKQSIAMIRRGDQLNWSQFNFDHQKHAFPLLERFFVYLFNK